MRQPAADLHNLIPVRFPLSRPAAESGASLEVEFRPLDRSVHNVRLMTHSFVQLAVNDHGFASRVTVTCAELVENVARTLGSRLCTLRVWISPADHRVRVDLSTEGGEDELRELERLVEQASQGNPVEAYTRALTGSGRDSETLLGLSRIRYEGQMALSWTRRGRRLQLAAETA